MVIARTLLFLFLLVCSAVPVLADVKIFVTNDVHGYVADNPEKKNIGYARLKAVADGARAEGHTVFVLDAGDAFSGSAFALIDQGRSVAKLMGQVGYRVLTPGNHAFDYTLSEGPLYYGNELLRLVRENSPGKVDAVAENLTYKGADPPGMVTKPVVIYDETAKNPQGMRVIVTGVITPYSVKPSLRQALADYDFDLKPTPEATKKTILDRLTQSLAPYDRPEDVVIVLSHLGYAGPKGDRDGRITGPDVAAVPNVDFVADGHSHKAVTPNRDYGAMYANGGRYLEHFMVITLDGKKGDMALKSYADVADVVPDKAMTDSIRQIDAARGLEEVIFTSPDDSVFKDGHLRKDSTPLGRLICESMAKAAGAAIALHTPGGIRAGLPGGPVHRRDLLDVLPFDDRLVAVDMTGKQIAEVFTRSAGHGGRGLPQFFGLDVWAWRDEDDALHVAGLRLTNGDSLQPDKTYRVALNGFMARNMNLPTKKDRGNLVDALEKQLKQGVDVEALRAGRNLFVFADKAAAEAAWKAGNR